MNCLLPDWYWFQVLCVPCFREFNNPVCVEVFSFGNKVSSWPQSQRLSVRRASVIFKVRDDKVVEEKNRKILRQYWRFSLLINKKFLFSCLSRLETFCLFISLRDALSARWRREGRGDEESSPEPMRYFSSCMFSLARERRGKNKQKKNPKRREKLLQNVYEIELRLCVHGLRCLRVFFFFGMCAIVKYF